LSGENGAKIKAFEIFREEEYMKENSGIIVNQIFFLTFSEDNLIKTWLYDY
jgi:hypothetical protein